MTDPGSTEAGSAARPALQAALEALRGDGAQRLDPIRFHYLERISQRAHAATGALRPILEERLEAALIELRDRLTRAQAASVEAFETVSQRHADPIGDLHLLVQRCSDGRLPSGIEREIDAPRELRSLRRFRKAWARISAQDRVAQALGRAPANAGPVNSHRLVLDSLELLRELSPDYLRRFLWQLDTLQRLEDAQPKPGAASARPVRRGRQKK